MRLLPQLATKSFALITIIMLALLSALAVFYFTRLSDEGALASHLPNNTGVRMAGYPKLFLWAWEREERLEFINPREVGVAFLAQTITIRGDKVIRQPRMQPLKVPAGTTLISVTRIESARDVSPLLSPAQRAEVAAALVATTEQKNISALQIDFDALASERGFYRDLLVEVRARMPKEMPLSITALASWCIYDDWLSGLPVDEAVPMLFSMGIDRQRITGYLSGGGDFRNPLCRSSSGVSTDEPVQSNYTARRVYVFNKQAWTEASVRRELERNRNENPAP